MYMTDQHPGRLGHFSHFEQLESRKLLSATLTEGILTITGTESADSIELDLRDNGQLKVEINEDEQEFAFESVNSIVIRALGGADDVEFNRRNEIAKTTEIFAGAGNDTVEGSDGGDTIRGGAGNDHLDGRAGNDVLFGNSGNDVLEGKAGDDREVGNSGMDSIQGHAGNDTLRGKGGDDDLEGGAGTDLLFGGGGNDDFQNQASNPEIQDLEGEDEGPNALI